MARGHAMGRFKAQSSIEYVVLIIAALAAAVGMRTYLRLAIQGRLNDARWTISGDTIPVDRESSAGQPVTWEYTLDTNEVTQGKITAKTDAVVGRQRIVAFQVDSSFTEETTQTGGP